MKRPIALAFVAALCAILATTSAAITVRITPDGSGDFPDIQTALNTCVTGDTLLVAPGIFQERLMWPETNGLVLIGETTAEACILDAGATGRVITMIYPVDETTVVKGLTLQNGWMVAGGGGILCSDASPTIEGIIIRNCIGRPGGAIVCRNGAAPLIIGNNLHDNEATGSYGGAIYMESGSSPTITSNVIRNNFGTWGGGIFVTDGCSPTITDNLIENNDAGIGGGGIYFWGDPVLCSGLVSGNEIRSNTALQTAAVTLDGILDVDFRGNLVRGNISDLSCGGIVSLGAENISTVSVNLILENSGPVTGGIWNLGSSAITIEGNLIHNNVGHGIYCEDGASPLIQQNDVHGHAGFYGLLNADETVTVAAENNWWGDISGPYHPVANPSGTGDWVSDHVDFDPWSVITGGGTPGAAPTPVLCQNQPNPFNPRTVITYTIPTHRHVRLTVHAVNGRTIATLVDTPMSAGRHEVVWTGTDRDGRPVPSGVYLYRLDSGDVFLTNRMVLVR